jgi:hypothetical protein
LRPFFFFFFFFFFFLEAFYVSNKVSKFHSIASNLIQLALTKTKAFFFVSNKTISRSQYFSLFRECHNIALKQTHEPEVPNVLNRGASTFALAYLNFLITVVSVNKLRLMWLPSFNLVPSAFVWEARSLPARSTRFCKVPELQST